LLGYSTEEERPIRRSRPGTDAWRRVNRFAGESQSSRRGRECVRRFSCKEPCSCHRMGQRGKRCPKRDEHCFRRFVVRARSTSLSSEGQGGRKRGKTMGKSVCLWDQHGTLAQISGKRGQQPVYGRGTAQAASERHFEEKNEETFLTGDSARRDNYNGKHDKHGKDDSASIKSPGVRSALRSLAGETLQPSSG